MREPDLWPYSSESEWRAWRDHLDTSEDLINVATLKREADAELARAARCLEGRRELRRPELVPYQRPPEAAVVAPRGRPPGCPERA